MIKIGDENLKFLHFKNPLSEICSMHAWMQTVLGTTELIFLSINITTKSILKYEVVQVAKLDKLQDIPVSKIVGISYILVSAFFTILLFPEELNWISIALWIWSVLMIVGQFAVFLPSSWAYYVYLVSFVLSIAFVNLIWLFLRLQPLLVAIYPLSTLLLVGLAYFIHHRTKETISSKVELVIFSVFSFGLILALSNWSAVPQLTADLLYLGGLVLFVVVSIFNLNTSYRANLLNSKLNMQDRVSMFRIYKRKLREKDKSSDIDLILYYFKSSTEQFVKGDFENSFMDAYKILFDKAFDKLHKIQNINLRRKPFKDIRNALAHAKVVKDVEKLREMKKHLCSNNLEILRIAKSEFMDVLSRESSENS